MKLAVRAGLFYFILVFAAAFVLGAVRVRLINPNFGEAVGLAIELPVILIWAWVACRWLVRRMRVSTATAPRLVMGAVALLLVLVAETLVGVLGMDQTLHQHFAAYGDVPTLLGLAAQICFAAMPWLRAKIVTPR
jgi:hypothetical protein